MADTTPPTDGDSNGVTPDVGGGRERLAVEPIEIQEEMERSFLDYAMSVIVSRARPDAPAGRKPGARPNPGWVCGVA